MNTLQYILDKYGLDQQARPPLKIDAGRDDLARLFAELGFVKGAEIGVEQGRYSEVLCRENPNLRLYAVDPWKAYRNYRDHVSQDKIDGFLENTIKRLKPYNAQVLRLESMTAVETFHNGGLDFVYIDANHEFLHVTQDIMEWSKKVRKGGIVAGHDFVRDENRNYVNHVKDVVQAWTYSHGIRPWFVMTADKSPSWFWVVS